jgi:hypothetical protein
MNATLDVSGTVTFHDAERQYCGAEVDSLLKEAQEQGALLSELDRELGRSTDFLSKVRQFHVFNDQPFLYVPWLSICSVFNITY